jgi:Transketolase, C-terminal subunit
MSTIKIATRESYGNALVSIGEKYPEVVVLDADLAAATKTNIFRKEYPQRHINVGIAESNMISIAAGMATMGKIPFVSSFAMFLAGRAFEQIRNGIGYPKLNVKICATHAGITVGEDGASHQCNEDIALMRTIPEMVIINPSDDIEAKAAVAVAAAYKGPMYLRFGRPPTKIINDNPKYTFTLGKGIILREGTDITIVATGLCVTNCLEVAELFSQEGISAEVINIHTIKPIDTELLVNSAKKTKHIITVEEHSIIGGLGSAVSEVLSELFPTKINKIGMPDCFGQSANADVLLKEYKLDTNGIYHTIKQLL